MSVLAYHSVADNEQIAHQSTKKGVDVTANISANARIDYILRFSKQLVVALTSQVNDYAPINSQFLADLPHSHNAALVAASNQFNDIQIRSRIIEQLFANILFDPEQSLAVSLINLTKEAPQDISIAIEHGQFLSVQILHELTQLAAIAKKSELTINVLITGDYALGHKLSQSSALFHGKTSIINGVTGQLIPLNSPLFKQPRVWFSAFYIKMACVLFTIMVMLAVGMYVFFKDKQDSIVSQSLTVPAFVNPEQPLKLTKKQMLSTSVIDTRVEYANVNTEAGAQDIMNALLLTKKTPPKVANNQDILHALTTVSASERESLTASKQAVTLHIVEPTLSTVADTKHINATEINQSIYFSLKSGYVIQFAAFAERKVKNDFIQLFPDLTYYRYYRAIEGKTFEVFTSQPYQTRDEVDAARAQLPDSIKSLNVWVKSLSAIQGEITAFNSNHG